MDNQPELLDRRDIAFMAACMAVLLMFVVLLTRGLEFEEGEDVDLLEDAC